MADNSYTSRTVELCYESRTFETCTPSYAANSHADQAASTLANDDFSLKHTGSPYMSNYDPTLEALIASMLEALDHEADLTRGYVDQLRQLIVTLTHILADPEGHPAPHADEPLMR